MVRKHNRNKKGKDKGNIKNSSKFRGNRHSVFKPKNRKKSKRKFECVESNHEDLKKKKYDNTVNEFSSDESEEETDDHMKQLLLTFNSNEINKKAVAVESEDSETDESEENSFEKANKCDLNNENASASELSDNEDDAVPSKNIFKAVKANVDIEKLSEIEEMDNLTLDDPFVKHLCYDLNDEFVEFLQNKSGKKTEIIEWPVLGKLLVFLPNFQQNESTSNKFTIVEDKKYALPGTIPKKNNLKNLNPTDVSIKSQIIKNIKPANKSLLLDNSYIFTDLQNELFSIVNNYQDLYYPERTFDNGEQIRFVYCLHAINHILKTRIKVLHHNARLKNKASDVVPDEYRDQGLVRPKVLIVVPFRDSALKVVQMLMDILVPDEKGQVFNKLRFLDDFSGGELILPKKKPKPEDYEKTFTGNCDDTFKIGIQVTKKSLKLYADFYSSDIIIASPLGLRLTVGAEGEAERDYDFLSSIELLIMDQMELFLMQNWDHLVHILDHLHLQPKEQHDTDFSRVRSWSLNGWGKYYRQTLIFSSVTLPEINSVFNKRCCNYAGAIRTTNSPANPSITGVHVQLPQLYRRFSTDSFSNCINDRFDFFINKVLPQYKDTMMKQCLIYVPNYFDYVKIRNYLKKEDISFVQICEYSKEAKVARARDIFFHGDSHFLLYSERYHFFHRIRLKGIRHLLFYQPPTFPHFYSEMCNLMQEANQNKKTGSASNMSVTVLYSKYDLHTLASVVGTERTSRMIASEKNVHMFTSSDK